MPVDEVWEGDDGESVLLESDGSGVVESLPYNPGPGCDPLLFEKLSGDVLWRSAGDDAVVLRQGDSEITLWADRGFGGEIIWREVVIGPCGKDTPPRELVRLMHL